MEHHQYSPRLGGQYDQPGAYLASGTNGQALLRPGEFSPKCQTDFQLEMVLLLILLRSAVPEIPGVVGMFIRLHHEVKNEDGRRVLVTAQVYGEMNLWRHLIHSLAARPTH